MLEGPSASPLAGAWDEALLAPVAELNERMLESLQRLALLAGADVRAGVGAGASTGACADAAGGHQVHDAAAVPAALPAGTGGATRARAGRIAVRSWPPLLLMLVEDWSGLDATPRRCLARCPYLLIDAGFGPGGRWERGGAELPMSAAAGMPPAHGGYFVEPEGVALVRRLLLFAWHLARSNRLAARVLLGMSALAAERVADCSLQRLDLLAEQRPAWIAPRWERQPQVWRQLLRAARSGQATQLRHAQLHGLQLLAAARAENP